MDEVLEHVGHRRVHVRQVIQPWQLQLPDSSVNICTSVLVKQVNFRCRSGNPVPARVSICNFVLVSICTFVLVDQVIQPRQFRCSSLLALLLQKYKY